MARVRLEEAATLLREGRVVGIPTETVYGLAACLHQPSAVEAIFALKGRPRMNPLIVHVANEQEARALASEWTAHADRLSALWPGPLTLLVPACLDRVPQQVRAGLSTVGIRVPAHPLCRALLELTGPLVAPSANLSGRPSSSTAAHVEDDFGEEFPVLDGGPCQTGLESTIVTTVGAPRLARLGALSAERIAELTGVAVLPHSPASDMEQQRPLCPGQLLQHYAPRARLHLYSAARPPQGALVLGFSDRHYPTAQHWSLGPSKDVDAVAQALYACLRRLDQEGLQEAWIDDRIPEEGLWRTIAERMHRATAHASNDLVIATQSH
jgi:L-threonylcarbamoyladenylate synthase